MCGVATKVTHYQPWEVEAHREHRDFHKRNSDEQKEERVLVLAAQSAR